jgi:hypothetical protein
MGAAMRERFAVCFSEGAKHDVLVIRRAASMRGSAKRI